LFAGGSSWSEIIPLLQTRGLTATSVRNSLTTLDEAVAACRGVLDRQDGPTVLAEHSFSGMIVTETGIHPKVSALAYVAARAPDAGEDDTSLAARFPAPPASERIVFHGDEGQVTEDASLRDFVDDLSAAGARVLFAVQQPFQRALRSGRMSQAGRRSRPSFSRCLYGGSNDQSSSSAPHGGPDGSHNS
jgi:hypothetical protein